MTGERVMNLYSLLAGMYLRSKKGKHYLQELGVGGTLKRLGFGGVH